MADQFDADAWSAHLATRCLSLYDGCCCHEPEGHEGLHRCPDETCGSTWTTEDAKRWAAEFQRGR